MKVHWKRLMLAGELPEARWGHTSSAIGNQIIVFGGRGNSVFGDLYVLDTDKALWIKPAALGTPPTSRLGHSATLLSDQRTILFFGGRGNSKHFSDIHMFDTERFVWLRVSQPKNPPDARAGHTAVLTKDGRFILVFGGHSHHFKYFKDLWMLDTNSLTWTKCRTSGETPSPRGSHVAFMIRDNMYIYGGFDGKKYYDDLYTINIENLVWRKVETLGSLPQPRGGHTATLIDNNLVIFGGCGPDSNFLNDLHVLVIEDTSISNNNNNNNNIIESGSSSLSRSRSRSVVPNDTISFRWEQPLVMGADPHPRFRHTSTLIGCHLYIFAGTGSGNLLSDVLVLDNDIRNPHSIVPTPTTIYRSPNTNQISNSPSLSTSPQISTQTFTTTTTTTTTSTSSNNPPSSSPTTHTLHSTNIAQSLPLPLDLTPPSSPSHTQNILVDLPGLLQLFNCVMANLNNEKGKDLDKKIEDQFTKFLEKVNKEQQGLHDKNLRAKGLMEYNAAQDLQAEKIRKKLGSVSLSQVDSTPLSSEPPKELQEKQKNKAEEKEVVTDEGFDDDFDTLRSKYARILGKDPEKLSVSDFSLLERPSVVLKQVASSAVAKKVLDDEKAHAKAIEGLMKEKEALTEGKQRSDELLSSLRKELDKKDKLLQEAVRLNETLQTKIGQLEGNNLDDVPLERLTELDSMYHNCIQRASQARQRRMEKELQAYKEQAARAQKEKEELKEMKMCSICVERFNNCVLLPCGHTNICLACAKRIEHCHLCRAEIKDRIETFP